jgi:hypothetical protein
MGVSTMSARFATHSIARKREFSPSVLVRIAIGFFLKMLAQIGRGFSDVVVYKENIYQQMVQLLNMAAVPVMTDLELELPGVRNCELYPFPLPDLFMGAPLTISGKYVGKFPSTVTLHGVAPLQGAGFGFSLEAKTQQSDVIPVGKVFLKQRLDLLTAKAWLEESKQIENEVVDLSCENSMPSAYTVMMAYETTEEQKHDLAKSKGKRKWYRDPKVLGALAVGNCMLIGAAAFYFGDLASSMGNVPVIGGIGDAVASIDGCDCCDCGCLDCCGDCDCSDCMVC